MFVLVYIFFFLYNYSIILKMRRMVLYWFLFFKVKISWIIKMWFIFLEWRGGYYLNKKVYDKLFVM